MAEKSELYVVLRREERKQEWHRVAMRLTSQVVVVIVYLVALLVVTGLRPGYDPILAAQLVLIGFAVAAGLRRTRPAPNTSSLGEPIPYQ